MSLSVIVPAYNVENYLKMSLDSIVEQTIPFDEVIIIDDGSVDATYQIASEYVKNNSNWKLIRTINQGQGFARNLGLLNSTSEFIYFFDSDDILDKNFVKQFFNVKEKFPLIELFLFSGESFSDNEKNSISLPTYDRKQEIYTLETDVFLKPMISDGTYTASPCLYVSKRSLWIKNNLLFDVFFFEDESTNLKLLYYCSYVYVSRTVLFYRRVRLGSTMFSSITQKHVDGDCLNLKNIIFLYRYEKLSNIFRKLLKRRATHYANRYVINSLLLGCKVNFIFLMQVASSLNSPYILIRSVYSYFRLKWKGSEN